MVELIEEDPMDEIVRAVESGKCVLFLGAAVHRPPPVGSKYVYLESERPPTGSVLSEQLAQEAGFLKQMPREDVKNLQRVSQYFELVKGPLRLAEVLIAAVATGKKPSPILHALAKLNFKIIVTTNYDKLMETALVQDGKRPFVSVYKKNEERDDLTTEFPLNEDVSADRPFVFKMHGDIDDSGSIVITDEDYIHFILRMTQLRPYDPIPQTFMEQFRKCPTLFIGYSLKDYNLRVLFRTLRWRIDPTQRPLTYSIDPYPDPIIKTVWGDRGRYVSFVAQDVWTFVPELYRRIKNEEMPG